MKPKPLLSLALVFLAGLAASAASVITRLQPGNVGDTSFSVKVSEGDFGWRFTVSYRTNGYTLDEFLHARLDVCDEDHQIASSAVEKTWTTNGVQFEFTISTNYLPASKFTIEESAHAGKRPMAATDTHWFYLRDFVTSGSLPPTKADDSNVVSEDIIKALPGRIQALHAGTTAGEVWNELKLAPYQGKLGGVASEEHERYWLSWNCELELTFEAKPASAPNSDRGKRKLISAKLFKNGLQISSSSK